MSTVAFYCRFCASEKPQQSLQSIKNNEKLLESVREKLIIFREEIVDFAKEKLPENICAGCLESLNKSYDFYVKSKEAQVILNVIFIDQQNNKTNMEPINIGSVKEEDNYFDIDCWTDRDTNPEPPDHSWSSYPWHCPPCGTTTLSMQDLRTHNQLHHGGCVQFKCMDCQRITAGFEDFVHHVQGHRPGLCNYCQYCNIKLESTAHIDTHKYNCNMCGQPFTHKTLLLTHLQNNTNLPKNNSVQLFKKKQKKKIKSKFKFKDGFVKKKSSDKSLIKRKDKYKSVVSNDIPIPPLFDTKLQRLITTIDPDNDIKTNTNNEKLSLETTVTIIKEEEFDKIELWSDYPHICKYCGLNVAGFTILKIHCISHHKKCFGMKCIDCDNDDSNTLEKFAQHVVKHRPDLMSSCHFCYSPISESEQQIHLQTHKSRFQCVSCGQQFKNMRDFRCHDNKLDPPLLKPPIKRRKIPLTDEEVVCNVCYFRAKSPWFLRKHKLRHTDRKRDFTCERCGKAFLSKCTLVAHTKLHKLHENEPKEICKICNKAFYTIKKLRDHVKNHNLVKPFQCDHCKKFFRSKDSLRSHVIVHMDIKPYACQYCQKRFKLKKHMQNHEYQHTGVKPFSCDICCVNFTCWSNCDKHLRRIHGMSLAKATVTPYGKMEIDPITGKPKQLSITSDLQEWTKNLIDVKTSRKKKMTKKNAELPKLSGT